MSKAEMMWVLGSVTMIALFFVGLWFSRSTRPMGNITWFGRVIDDPAEILEKTRLLGRIFMIVAPAFLVVWTLMLFGFFGPVGDLEPVRIF